MASKPLCASVTSTGPSFLRASGAGSSRMARTKERVDAESSTTRIRRTPRIYQHRAPTERFAVSSLAAMSAPLPPPASAAALVIGNELLSGKVEEANVVVLARTLRGLGVELRRVVVILDDIDEIAREVKALSKSHDWVFTSGGVGPTHDDVTVEGVAKAFGVAAVEHPFLAKQLRDHYKERCTDGHLRMALVPEGATLETSAEIRWPTIRLSSSSLCAWPAG